jgi:hypothetical protein
VYLKTQKIMNPDEVGESLSEFESMLDLNLERTRQVLKEGAYFESHPCHELFRDRYEHLIWDVQKVTESFRDHDLIEVDQTVKRHFVLLPPNSQNV